MDQTTSRLQSSTLIRHLIDGNGGNGCQRIAIAAHQTGPGSHPQRIFRIDIKGRHTVAAESLEADRSLP